MTGAHEAVGSSETPTVLRADAHALAAEKRSRARRRPPAPDSKSATVLRDPSRAQSLAEKADSNSTSGGFLRRPTAVTPGFGVLRGVGMRRSAEDLAVGDFAPRAGTLPRDQERSREPLTPETPRASVADAAPPKSGERMKLPDRPREKKKVPEELLQFASGLELSRMTPSARSVFSHGIPSQSNSESKSDSDSKPISPIPYPSNARTRTRKAPRRPAQEPARPAPNAQSQAAEMFPPQQAGPPETGPTYDRPPMAVGSRVSDSRDYDAMFEPPTRPGTPRPIAKRPDLPEHLQAPSTESSIRKTPSRPRPNQAPAAAAQSHFEPAGHGQRSMFEESQPPSPQSVPAPPPLERLQVTNPLQAAALQAAKEPGAQEALEEHNQRRSDELARKAARNQSILIALLAFLLGMGVVWAFFV